MDTSQTYLDSIKHTGLGIVVKENVADAKSLASSIIKKLCPDLASPWICSTSQIDKASTMHDVPLIITIGGDGTILRTARLAAPQSIPILGINMGGVGYLTELDAPITLDDLLDCLATTPRIEERSMLKIKILDLGMSPIMSKSICALNEVVVARNGIGKLTTIDLTVDDFECPRIRSDGVVVATPTGSTAYARSLGGPVVHPESSDLLLLLPASQGIRINPMILGTNSTIRLKPAGTDSMAVSVDGFMDYTLNKDEVVEISSAECTTKFLRYRDARDSFYPRLWKTL